MKYLILNADTPTGFYLINRLMLQCHKVDAMIVNDGLGDEFIHQDQQYINPTPTDFHTLKSNNYDGIFYVGDTYRIYNDFVSVIYTIMNFHIPIVAVFDWEIFNGVKRGNFPVSTATTTKPDSLRGVSKIWIKDTLLQAARAKKATVSVIVTPSVLSPFSLTKNVRNGAEYYLAQKLWEALECFKTGETLKVNRGDLRVIYDIVHNTDVAQAMIDLMINEQRGYFMLSSNVYLRFEEILEIFYGRLVQTDKIPFEDTGIEVQPRRRTLENYDTMIDTVFMWTDVIYHTWYPMDTIFDDIIDTVLSVEKDYEIAEKAVMHLIL